MRMDEEHKFNNENKTYDDIVEKNLQYVKEGLDLCWIPHLFRTKEICLESIIYEFNRWPNLDKQPEYENIKYVPLGNIDYVYEKLKELKKDDLNYLKKLEKDFQEIKQRPWSNPYFKSYQEMLDYYKVKNYDDMIRKIKNYDDMRCKLPIP